jgi:hypothetical protein|tara:strand:+ start:82 stop:342 length:261 start_codon:yes stop_codon:yes gene_type:complete
MSEQKEGFFSQIKNQIITVVGIVITAAGGLLVSNMEALFTPDDSPRKEQTIDIPTPLKDTIVITKIIKPVVKKTETEKRKKEGLDW